MITWQKVGCGLGQLLARLAEVEGLLQVADGWRRVLVIQRAENNRNCLKTDSPHGCIKENCIGGNLVYFKASYILYRLKLKGPPASQTDFVIKKQKTKTLNIWVQCRSSYTVRVQYIEYNISFRVCPFKKFSNFSFWSFWRNIIVQNPRCTIVHPHGRQSWYWAVIVTVVSCLSVVRWTCDFCEWQDPDP